MLIDASMMGVPYSDLLEMNEYEFQLYKIGYSKRQENQWEHTRFVAWMIQATQSTKPVKIEDVLPLPIDELRKKEQSKLKKSVKKSPKQYNAILQKLGLDNINDK